MVCVLMFLAIYSSCLLLSTSLHSPALLSSSHENNEHTSFWMPKRETKSDPRFAALLIVIPLHAIGWPSWLLKIKDKKTCGVLIRSTWCVVRGRRSAWSGRDSMLDMNPQVEVGYSPG
ncbi:hypothetical protein CPB84DRAFT_1553429 [Gymnopilus junonius]|uniref:Secreted protein n=1 Tax=Gymnopilus junonius TaxID=109634 RepID=A0A9P5NI15_GYMJU|nr:hypothetical protein CPB84DRAFT_1553429 [Gymnopilus junonius]